VVWANEHHILPHSYLRGFLNTYAATTQRKNFLMGETSLTGWWYYFPLAMLFKTPLSTLIAVLVALFVVGAWVARQIGQAGDSHLRKYAWPICALVICPAFYMLFSLRTHTQIGLRHVFPIYPFIFIFLGVSAAVAMRRFPEITKIIAVVLILGLAMETWQAFPNFIPFFNVAVGGPIGGEKLLGDCNIDWGQDLPALAQWQRENPGHQLYLSYFGSADPSYYKIHYLNAFGSYAHADMTLPIGLPPVLAISAVNLQGEYLTPQDRQRYRPLQDQQPIAILGNSIYLFHPP
jgi:hypothetical protein